MDYHQTLMETGFISYTFASCYFFVFLHENDKGITAEEIYLLSQKKKFKKLV